MSTDMNASGGRPSELPREVVFDILSSERRRRVLQYLLDVADHTTLRDLSRTLAAWENEIRTAEVTSKQRKRVYTALKQFHLPKMDRADVIDYDDDRGTVVVSEAARNLRIYLEIVPENEIPWSEFYLGLGALSCAAVAAVWMGAIAISAASGLVLAGAIALCFTVAAGAHVYSNRHSRLENARPTLEE